MRPSPLLTALSVVVLAGSLFAARPASAQISVEFLTPLPGAEFTDKVGMQIRNQFSGRGTDVINMGDASNIVVAKITIQPGAVFPWHTHPGPVLISIVEGDFVYVLASDCVRRWYTRGNALIDAGFGNVHTALNPGNVPTVVIATMLAVPPGDPVTIPVPGPDPQVCPLPTP